VKPLHLFLVLAVIFVWGLNFVAVKVALDGMSPLLLCFSRFLFCLPALLLIPHPPIPFKKVAIYSLVMFVLQFWILFTGMQVGLSPALASVLLQLQTFFAIGFGVVFMREKLQFWQMLGAGIASLGIVLIATHIGGEISAAGLFLVLFAALLWASGSFLAKKFGQGSGLQLVVWSSFYACPPLLALTLLLEGPQSIADSLQRLTWLHIGAVTYIAFFATLFGFGIWNWLLHYYPLSKLSSFTLLIPIVGMLSSAILLGEPLQGWKIGAGALIVAGVGINLFGAKRPLAQSHFLNIEEKP